MEYEKFEKNKWILFGLIVLAYLFSFGVRLYWPMNFAGVEQFIWNNEFMINTNDGYYFASTIKEMINNTGLQFGNAIDITPALVYTGVAFVKFSPFSLETVILYMPSVISSLIVIPIILTARLFNHTALGFLAALLGSIAWSYYNRTMVGYFDSDMFSVLLQFIIFYSFMRIAFKKDIGSVVFSVLVISFYPYFYPQGLTIAYAMFIILLVYLGLEQKGLVKSTETENILENQYNLFYIIILLSIALIFSIPLVYKFIILVAIFFLIKSQKISYKHMFILSAFVFVLFLVYANVFNVILANVFSYTNRGTQEEGLHFFKVIQTVREAGAIPIETIANRISGSMIGMILSFIGYILLVIRHNSFIIGLPLMGLGLFAYVGGLRFTVFAVPLAALSAVYLFYFLGSYLKTRVLQYSFVVIATAAMIYPNITHIIGYKVPTVFNKTEVQVLDKIKSVSTPDDYTIAWWDYGYPIWYYSNTHTLIDGGKHHNDNFIVSQILTTTSQVQAANLLRLAVETYVSSDYKVVANTIFKNKHPDQLNPNILLEELNNKEYKLPEKTRDVFFYLPNRMLNILPTVGLFSNLDLMTGKQKSKPFFYQSRNFKESPKGINLGSGVYLHNNKGQVQIGKNLLNINNFIVTMYDKQGILHKKVQTLDRNSGVNVIFMKNYNTFLVLDNNMYNSTFIQMFVLENYDKNLFEPVVLNPMAKVYKLKI